MNKFFSTIAIAAVVSAGSLSASFAAEPIEGTWKRNDGTLIKFSGSGGRYCGTVANGKYKGKSIGCLRGKGNRYDGSINVLSEGKTYTGKAVVSGNTMKMSGCVLKVICKGENLRRQ
ncbi:DUF2147 domain-containing protein [Pseudahrensia aquimaris]|uniref:DUF2147 domain-containing protein n=1 Tax=Pseudahrensia aquimaris TaxID=744461 RepID=A0ABW3FD61_9HYPH